MATRWIENHRRAAGREVASHIIRAAALRRILEQPGCVGISLQYGVDEYAGTVKSHFYGRNTFIRLLDEQRSGAVRATPASDDDRVPQLLLSDAAKKEPRVYEDRSFPCPSACPSHSEF